MIFGAVFSHIHFSHITSHAFFVFTLFPGASYFIFSMLLSTQNLSQSPEGLFTATCFQFVSNIFLQYPSMLYRAAIHQMPDALSTLQLAPLLKITDFHAKLISNFWTS